MDWYIDDCKLVYIIIIARTQLKAIKDSNQAVQKEHELYYLNLLEDE